MKILEKKVIQIKRERLRKNISAEVITDQVDVIMEYGIFNLICVYDKEIDALFGYKGEGIILMTANEKGKNFQEQIYLLVEEYLICILENSVNDNKRCIKLSERTKKLRPEYSWNDEESRKKIKKIILRINLLKKEMIQNELEKEYTIEIKKRAIGAIGHLIIEKWIGDTDTLDEDILDKWEKIIIELGDSKKSRGKILKADEICRIIEYGLFFDFEITNQNRYYGYFTKYDFEFASAEQVDTLEKMESYEKKDNVKKIYFEEEAFYSQIMRAKDHGNVEYAKSVLTEWLQNNDNIAYLEEQNSVKENKTLFDMVCTKNSKEAWLTYYENFAWRGLCMDYSCRMILEDVQRRYNGRKSEFEKKYKKDVSSMNVNAIIKQDSFWEELYLEVQGKLSPEMFAVIWGLIDLPEYWMLTNKITKSQYENWIKSIEFEEFVEGLIISIIENVFGVESALYWGKENGYSQNVNIRENAPQAPKNHVKWLIRKNVYSLEVMKHWLLIPTLDRLCADDLTLAEESGQNKNKETEWCVNVEDEMSRGVKEIILKTNVIFLANMKQNRSKKDLTELDEMKREKCEKINEANDEKKASWTTYKYQKPCLKYLMLPVSEYDTKAKWLVLGKNNAISIEKSFFNITKYYEEIVEEVSLRERYMSLFYLNQLIHYDIAVELMNGIMQIAKVSGSMLEGMKDSIVSLTTNLVHLHRRIKCGVSKIVFEYFVWKKDELDCKISSADKMVELLDELNTEIECFLKSKEVNLMQNAFHKELLQNSWNAIEENEFSYRGEIETNQRLSLELQVLMTKENWGKQKKEKKEQYLKKVRKKLYSDNIKKVLFWSEKKGDVDIVKCLGISGESWENVKNEFKSVLPTDSPRRITSKLYVMIQNALINANYDNQI